MNTIKTLSVIALTAAIVASCNPPAATDQAAATAAPAEKQALPVKVMELSRTKIARTLDFAATVQPMEEVSVSPATPGRIDKIDVEVGDRVRKGDNLFVMDRTQLMQARIQLAGLAKDLARLDTLLQTGSTRQQQYDQLKLQYDLTKSNVEFMEENTAMTAPFGGVVTGRYYEAGEMYTGAPSAASGGKAGVLTIMQINPVKAMLSVSEQYYPMVRRGMPVKVTSDIFRGEVFAGRVYLVHPVVNAMTRSFQVEIEVPNQKETLRPGMFVRASMDLGEVETFVVPASTILIQEGTNIRYVFVEKNGVVKRVEVVPGKRFDDMVEIVSEELAEGDMLVTQGQSKLVTGDKVEIVK